MLCAKLKDALGSGPELGLIYTCSWGWQSTCLNPPNHSPLSCKGKGRGVHMPWLWCFAAGITQPCRNHWALAAAKCNLVKCTGPCCNLPTTVCNSTTFRGLKKVVRRQHIASSLPDFTLKIFTHCAATTCIAHGCKVVVVPFTCGSSLVAVPRVKGKMPFDSFSSCEAKLCSMCAALNCCMPQFGWAVGGK